MNLSSWIQAQLSSPFYYNTRSTCSKLVSWGQIPFRTHFVHITPLIFQVLTFYWIPKLRSHSKSHFCLLSGRSLLPQTRPSLSIHTSSGLPFPSLSGQLIPLNIVDTISFVALYRYNEEGEDDHTMMPTFKMNQIIMDCVALLKNSRCRRDNHKLMRSCMMVLLT